MSGDCVDVYMSIIRSPYSSDLVGVYMMYPYSRPLEDSKRPHIETPLLEGKKLDWPATREETPICAYLPTFTKISIFLLCYLELACSFTFSWFENLREECMYWWVTGWGRWNEARDSVVLLLAPS